MRLLVRPGEVVVSSVKWRVLEKKGLYFLKDQEASVSEVGT